MKYYCGWLQQPVGIYEMVNKLNIESIWSLCLINKWDITERFIWADYTSNWHHLRERFWPRFWANFTSEMPSIYAIYGANFTLEIASILDEFPVDYYGAILTEYGSNFGMKMSEFQNVNERFWANLIDIVFYNTL